MTDINDIQRRRFLRAAALSAGGVAASGLLPPALRDVLATPSAHKTGTISDAAHVVIFMQENRAFDHYFGSLSGVRGYGDRVPPPLPTGRSTFYQPWNDGPDGYMLPFHMDTTTTSGICADAAAMSYSVDIAMWNGGKFDAWNTARDPVVGMGHFKRADLPFYYALADAFTICDQYYASTLTQTNPNRLHTFTGSNGLSVGQSAILDNTEPSAGFTWTTYAERLQQAGVNWKVYQQSNNFDDNALVWFKNFKKIKAGNPLYDRGLATVPDLVAAFADDVKNDTLPQVSWIVAPDYLSEHASYKPAYGEDLSARLLAALASNPKVYAKTIFILCYDENGGFYDHLPPPMPPATSYEGMSTVTTDGEITDGKPIGLGFRVPMILVSPWTRGGWVCSEVFDHTSLLRFLETRFGVAEPNISEWRRTVCGDLTSAFDFSGKNNAWPHLPATSKYPDQADQECSSLPAPSVPTTQAMPVPESGTRLARALPYALDANGHVDVDAGQYLADFTNTGSAGAVFQIYASNRSDGPWRHTVGAGKKVSDYWSAKTYTDGIYKIEVHAPNGFLRVWEGSVLNTEQLPEIKSQFDAASQSVELVITNAGTQDCTMTVRNAYQTSDVRTYNVPAGGSVSDSWKLANDANWYDLSATVQGLPEWKRRLAGHLENGLPSLSDPLG